jgi:hypothetical protein
MTYSWLIFREFLMVHIQLAAFVALLFPMYLAIAERRELVCLSSRLDCS